MLGVRGIFGSERGSGRPALGGEDAVAEARGIVGPGGVLRVVGDAGAAGRSGEIGIGTDGDVGDKKKMRRGAVKLGRDGELVGRLYYVDLLFRRCETHFRIPSECGGTGRVLN